MKLRNFWIQQVALPTLDYLEIGVSGISLPSDEYYFLNSNVASSNLTVMRLSEAYIIKTRFN